MNLYLWGFLLVYKKQEKRPNLCVVHSDENEKTAGTALPLSSNYFLSDSLTHCLESHNTFIPPWSHFSGPMLTSDEKNSKKKKQLGKWLRHTDGKPEQWSMVVLASCWILSFVSYMFLPALTFNGGCSLLGRMVMVPYSFCFLIIRYKC